MTNYLDALDCLIALSNAGIRPVRIKIKRGSQFHAQWGYPDYAVVGTRYEFGGCEVIFV